jgi:1-deoxyxylulose-5-phosphate synthase
MDMIELGHTGLCVSRLGFGTGSHGWNHHSEQTALGLEELAALLREAYELGVNFWDAADQYGSHPHVAEALKQIPRDKVVLTTKTTAKKKEQVTRDIERFLKELNTDVLDVVLLHGLSADNWPRKMSGAMEALTKAKEAGKVRAVGMSCHSLGALHGAVSDGWSDVVLVRINYAGARMDGRPAEVTPIIQQLYDAGKGLYAMKALGCGELTGDVKKAFSYVLGLGTVHALSIGTSSRDQLHENVQLMDELTPQYPTQPI